MPAINSDSPAIFTNMKHNLNDFEKLLRSDVLQELTFSSHIKKKKKRKITPNFRWNSPSRNSLINELNFSLNCCLVVRECSLKNKGRGAVPQEGGHLHVNQIHKNQSHFPPSNVHMSTCKLF